MDHAKALIRSVVRAFYETRHVLVVDALMLHSALPTEDLAYLLGMQQKDLRKVCGKLREDRLIAVHTRPETRDGFQRPINKDYYFIDFHATIDAIKYRVFNLTRAVESMYSRNEEKKDYHCPQCQAQWTQMEVLDKNEGDSTGHEKQSRLMSQLDGVLKMLKHIDAEDIPPNDFNAAIALTLPVARDAGTNPGRATLPVTSNGNTGPPAAVKGITQMPIVPLDVSVTAGPDKTDAEIAAESKRKLDIAAQNALPVWHTTSTVTGKSVTVPLSNDNQPSVIGAMKNDEDEKKDINGFTDELDAYYAQMAQEKEKEAQEDLEDDESSGEEADEFENVGIVSVTPEDLSTLQLVQDEGSRDTGDIDGVQDKGSDSGTSPQVLKSTSPAASGHLMDSEPGPVSKRVKFEDQTEIKENDTSKDSDEDQEVEFEDV